jgi:peptide/nickel transport system ATP-binding protein
MALERVREAVGEMGIDPERLNDPPHRFSGGERQRLMIALSLLLSPALVIADEPTSALDAVLRHAVIDQFRAAIDRHQAAALLISHDLASVARISDRLAVMYAGQIVEEGPAGDVLKRPAHPYTQGLLASRLSLTLPKMPITAIQGSPPSPLEPVDGCAFRLRCQESDMRCNRVPARVCCGADHWVACHRGCR